MDHIANLFPFISLPSKESLPYIMGTYKIHKNSFRWLTNAHDCLFSPITNFITSALQIIFLVLKDFTDKLQSKLSTFSQVKTNALWLIESQYDFLVNLPDNIQVPTCETERSTKHKPKPYQTLSPPSICLRAPRWLQLDLSGPA